MLLRRKLSNSSENVTKIGSHCFNQTCLKNIYQSAIYYGQWARACNIISENQSVGLNLLKKFHII